MKVRMKTLYADADGLVVQPDQLADFDRKTAEQLIAGGFARAVDDDPSRPTPDAKAPRRTRARKPAESAPTEIADGQTGEDPADGE